VFISVSIAPIRWLCVHSVLDPRVGSFLLLLSSSYSSLATFFVSQNVLTVVFVSIIMPCVVVSFRLWSRLDKVLGLVP